MKFDLNNPIKRIKSISYNDWFERRCIKINILARKNLCNYIKHREEKTNVFVITLDETFVLTPKQAKHYVK